MCAPCCQFTYEKYLDENGKLDEQKWHELFQEYNKMLPESFPVEKRVRMYLSPCKCLCHREGMDVMH